MKKKLILLTQVVQEQRVKRVKTGPLPEIFLSLTVMVDAEKTADVVETAHFHFTDTDEHIIVKVLILLFDF